MPAPWNKSDGARFDREPRQRICNHARGDQRSEWRNNRRGTSTSHEQGKSSRCARQGEHRFAKQDGRIAHSIKSFDKPLTEATTSSLEALKFDTEAAALNNNGDFQGAIAPSQRSIELDPNFAMGYRGLAVEYFNLNQLEIALGYIKKAFDLKDRASEREKYAIESDFYQYTGQIEKSTQSYEQYKNAYPRDLRPVNNLSVVYFLLGEWDKSLQYAQEGIRLDPDQYNCYSLASFAYAATNRMDDAKAILQTAQQRKLGSIQLHESLAAIALAEGDSATLEKENALARATPEGVYDLLYRDANLAGAHGQVRRSAELFKQANEKAGPLGLGDSVLNNVIQVGTVKVMAGDRAGAISESDAVLKQSQAPTILLSVADNYARAGEDAQAEKLVERAVSERPLDENIQNLYAPMIRAVIAMNHHDAQKAIELMKAALPYDGFSTEAIYTRASAFLMAGQSADAVREFQRILDLKNASPQDLFVGYAQLGLARAYALDPDKAKARTAYQDFFAQWKNADPDLPVLKQAQAEYAKLK